MKKLSYDEFKAMMMDPSVPDSAIAPYLTVVPEKTRPFDPRFVPDPTNVEINLEAEFDVESAIRWGNATCRWRRQQRFLMELARGSTKPVLVSEGDSWFQFPFLIDDVIDHLGKDFLIWSLDAAGDTADNMVNRKSEYKAGLDAQKPNNVTAFLFSAAGNDVIGENLNGIPALSHLIKPYKVGKDAAWHVDNGQLAAVLARLEGDYRHVVSTVRGDQDFATLPIFIHGYDYAIPGGYPGDKRHPIYAKQDEWLGRPMVDKGILDIKLQRAIIRLLIDALYDMLHRVAGQSATTRIYVVDVRETLKEDEWADEIHGTSPGFAKIAKIFSKAIKAAI